MENRRRLELIRKLRDEQTIENIDHIVHVTQIHKQQQQAKRWSKLGFMEHCRVQTTKYPALHIAFAKTSFSKNSSIKMMGLSVSKFQSSPINEFIRRYGEGVQHWAYSLNPDLSIKDIYEYLQENDWDFLTPILTYEDQQHAQLHQFYTKPFSAYGQFIEFIQRPYSPQGDRFNNFGTANIEDFYEYYADYSKYLEKQKHLTHY